MNNPIYLDYNATTPVAPEVTDAMLPFLRKHFGNPSSSHPYGRQAAEAVINARTQVALLIGAQTGEILFTGCATEANNLALLGVARALTGTKRHILISSIEHPAVMAPAKYLESQGWHLTILPVDGFGRVSPDDVAHALRPDTALVSIMHANNEIGTIQPIDAISKITRAQGVLFHTDAAQSAGKVAINVNDLGVDLLTLAGHKFYATKGVGALYVRAGTPIHSILHGADQERSLRPGTENVPAIVGIGAAAKLAQESLPGISAHLRHLRDLLHQLLTEAIPNLVLNGHPQERLPNTLHVSFPGITGKALLHRVQNEVAASLGSACHSEHDAVSGVLAALSINSARASGAVRLSVGMMTAEEDIIRAAKILIVAWRELIKQQ
jgi:cysteine desulfurase